MEDNYLKLSYNIRNNISYNNDLENTQIHARSTAAEAIKTVLFLNEYKFVFIIVS